MSRRGRRTSGTLPYPAEIPYQSVAEIALYARMTHAFEEGRHYDRDRTCNP